MDLRMWSKGNISMKHRCTSRQKCFIDEKNFFCKKYSERNLKLILRTWLNKLSARFSHRAPGCPANTCNKLIYYTVVKVNNAEKFTDDLWSWRVL